MKRVAVRKRRPGPPRRGPANIDPQLWRCPAYLAFLREEGRCVACTIEWDKAIEHGGTVTTFAHLRGDPTEPQHGPPNGRSQKGPDAGAIPGCREHHDEQTRIGWSAFEAKYGFSRAREAAVWFAAFKIWKEAKC